MGRELRRVPADWNHPRNDKGKDMPLYDNDYRTAAAKWKAGFHRWEAGDDPARKKYGDGKYEYWEWCGDPPSPEFYRPAWLEEHRTHYQMYETITEGTPVSPVMPDIESLSHWLADNHASAFGPDTATYDQWLAMCRQGSCMSAFVEHGPGGTTITSGVASCETDA